MNIRNTVFLLMLSSLLTGCATPYMQDRKNDAADIFTATVGYGAGAKARVGPINLGLLLNSDQYGYRKGCHVTPRHDLSGLGMTDATCTLLSLEWFGSGWGGIAGERGKYYEALGVCGLSWAEIWGKEHPPWNANIPYYTQIDAVIGVGGSLRLGFNLGELIDFLLGWTTIDIFSDDVEVTKQNTKSNQPVQATARTLAAPDR